MKKVFLILAIASLGAIELKDYAIAPDMSQEELNCRLFKAINDGNIREAKNLLSQGADANEYTPGRNKAMTPLLAATEMQSKNTENIHEMVKLLLEEGADPNRSSLRNYTPLMGAVTNPSVSMETIKLLLSKGADPRAGGKKALVLVEAIAELKSNTKKEMIELLLDQGLDPNIQDTESGQTKTALTIVISSYNLSTKEKKEIVKLLIDKGANPNTAIESAKGWQSLLSLLKAYQVKPTLEVFAQLSNDPKSFFSTIPNDVLFLILEQVIGRKITQEDRTLYDQITKLPQQPVALTKEQQEIADKVKDVVTSLMAGQTPSSQFAADAAKPR